ncbi:hypothetical protein [Vibrio parahaemolyticus]|uniref:hypothetical protein n=1 Tax=Vibrio parahaemolyticus TaxID=670 RepID=UPI001DB2A515|nr:hypothetical protein [Vibrio parahaemolyticus]MBE4231405.1 hypothetical protein [Vibrio parahaemolyticus]MCZ6417395.1 hypothetical protein [Vibrio parahaemolyticus]MCZ6422362.1 hypothetical protein [Vibrio parahaemolyticus]MEA5339193.1 hypothetical protein [Vibrio parahaemolyticus]WCZ04663.1 hypothetical protein GSS61_26505 [Vibrio parahaemolyticus]
MSKPQAQHPFRVPISEHPLKGLSTSKPTQKQQSQKQARDRIEQIMEQREFDKEWGEQ